MPEEIKRKIEEISRSKGISRNKAFLELLEKPIATTPTRIKGPREEFPEDLEQLFGAWTDEEAHRFAGDLKSQRRIDPEIWARTD